MSISFIQDTILFIIIVVKKFKIETKNDMIIKYHSIFIFNSIICLI